MLELKTIDSKGLTIEGVSDFLDFIKGEEAKVYNVIPTKENIAFSSDEVTKHNKAIKDFQAQVDAVTDKYNEPLEALLAPVKEAIANYTNACKEYQASNLDAKKEAFKDKAKAHFTKLAMVASPTGEIPDFDSFYEDKWYQCKNDDALDACIAEKLKRQKEVADDKAVAVFSIKGSDKIAIVEDFLIKNRINYEKL